MRNIAFIGLILGAGILSFSSATQAQTGAKKPPRTPGGSIPTRPGASRGSSAATKPASKPSARIAETDTASETGSDETADDRRFGAGSSARGGSRFDNAAAAEPSETVAPEVDDSAVSEEPVRTASRDNRTTPREPSRRLLNNEEPAPESREGEEPAPLNSRGAVRSIEAQAIQMSFNETAAGRVLGVALNFEHPAAMTGFPIRLEQLVASSPDNNSRRLAVKAYWNLVVSIADYHHSLDELDRISQMAANSSEKLIEAAAAAAKARVAEAKLTAMAAQYDLAAFSPSPTALPIPVDAPVIGEYRTEYTALFGRGPAPLGIKRLALMLPLYRDQVVARGEAVYAASEAQSTSEDLQTFKELSGYRRAFLLTVRDYNEAIADYALQLTTPGMSVDTVTSMLIVRSQPAADSPPELSTGATQVNSEVVRASATAPIDKSVIKPRQIGSFKEQRSEEEMPLSPDEEEAEPSSAGSGVANEPDATEAPAERRSGIRFGKGTEEE